MKYVIIGGDAAGMSAAMQIVRNSSEESLEIVTLEKGEIYSYGQCGLPYVVGGTISSTEDVIARKVQTFRDKYGIDARTNHEVTLVDSNEKMVHGKHTQTGEPFSITYDKLLVASGATPAIPSWNNAELNGIFVLKTIPDTNDILDYMDETIQQVTIVGGGYIGLEMAENFKSAGKEVRIIQRGNQLLGTVDADIADKIHSEAVQHGIEIIYDESVHGFEGKDRVEKVYTDQHEYNTDLVLVSVGVQPNTNFLDQEVFNVGSKGELIVDEFMRTNVPDVYAAGDCACQYNRVLERNDYIPLGTHANKQGMVAGMNLVGIKKKYAGMVGTSILKFFNLDIGKTGISVKEAESEDFPYDFVEHQATSKAGYYSKDEKLTIKMVYHSDTKKLLGAQLIGNGGVDKRLDVLATSLFHGMTTEELLDLDLAYAPPYNGVWDPIQQAAKRTL
ncbi:CoA-disulfide reductase [Halalkalibacillus sediminis]|uniref:CoA-disulfide reductase n=1 Tax=Halalkalibacillus sediminis TaxID=2018042 RepID=A0A2I0QVZ8_9BACI|nr:FAD-dependent oxidoreductase [Halalkalibacillus sediminis]PKR78469.1 CoA-disulfide reductase [Halalkalibacillus sediminis]